MCFDLKVVLNCVHVVERDYELLTEQTESTYSTLKCETHKEMKRQKEHLLLVVRSCVHHVEVHIWSLKTNKFLFILVGWSVRWLVGRRRGVG